jgi:hypothetical protein
MRVRRAHEGAMQLAREYEIGDEPSAPGEKPRVFLAQHRRADAFSPFALGGWG